MDITLSMLQMQAAMAQAPAAVTNARPAPPQQAASFEAMMQNGVMGPGAPNEDTTGTLVSEVVRGEDTALQSVSNDMLFMLQNSSGMSMQQLTAATMAIQVESTNMQVDLQTKMAVVNSSKDALETLMKNQ
ncbi:MAG: serine kinase [Pseudomonadota bacterium]|jgi:type III secretion inner rod protein HrpB2|uniref:serine kinase n=1 Tax=Burkholderiaceae TaxID=119060 RepID=UPI0010F8649A|nr:serine kinase [Burkholderia sp. 4M9327F10]